MGSPAHLKRLSKAACHLSVHNLAASFLAASLLFMIGVGHKEVLARLHVLRPMQLFFLAAAVASLYLRRRHRAVYLVEYACFRAAPVCRAPSATFVEHTRLMQRPLDDDGAAASFTAGMLERSGFGEETCVPPAFSYIPPDQSLQAARDEAELVIFSTVDALFAKAASRGAAAPGDIDLVIVCCSLLAPAPAFSDMVVNRYGMHSGVRSVNLSGMGCGAGLIALELAGCLLRALPPGARAPVVTTEIMSSNYYVGSNRSMLATNWMFRMSGAAMLMSTSPAGARFRLGRAVRTCGAAQDSAYRCVFQEEDDKGNIGTRLDAGFLAVAGDMLKANIEAFAPYVLPVSELLRFVLSAVARRIQSQRAGGTCRPNFRRAFEHFCVHAGTLGVVDAMQRSLGISDDDVEAARMTVHRFGYTSSSSVMYQLAYVEARGRMRKGDRVWMISFGAGFECSSVAWEFMEPASDADVSWADCIHRYPLRLAGGSR